MPFVIFPNKIFTASSKLHVQPSIWKLYVQLPTQRNSCRIFAMLQKFGWGYRLVKGFCKDDNELSCL
jgi:hypothetical protein